MRDLIDAAVQSAARQGIQAAVVLVDGGARVQTPAASVAGAGVQVEEKVAALQEHLTQAAKARDSALRQNEQLSQQYREAQARVAELEGQLQTAAQAPAPAADQPAEVVDYDAMPISSLSLPEKVGKVCEKNDIATIGQLRGFFATLGEHKVTQKDRIITAEALMGRIPSSGAGSVTVTPGANASDVPAGHVDRPWKDRLNVTRFKENKAKALAERLDEMHAGLAGSAPGFPGIGEPDFWARALAAICSIEGEGREAAITALAAYIGQQVMRDITTSQAQAMVYALGFDPKQHRTLDAALEAAGLVHLSESVPA